MKLFITGGTGNLGTHLVPALLKAGHTLTLLSVEPRTPFDNDPAVHCVVGDLLDPKTYTEAIDDSDAIIHMAAVTHTNDTDLYYRINTEGTKVLLDAARSKKVPRFIFVSTRAVGRTGGAYSHSKEKAEKLVEQSGLSWTIVRPAEVYGVTENEAIAKVIATVETMPLVPLIGNGTYRIAPVHIDDVITALTMVLERPESIGKTYTLAGPEDMTYNAFIRLVLAAKKVHKPVLRIPMALIRVAALIFAVLKLKRPFIVQDQIPRLILKKSADISAAVADLDYHPIALKSYLTGARS